ncbi:hypothetical protein GCM10010106_30640 [Thermopolyspora flexuosa]|nr:hypothetical protein GCM10010106_30640 [Thermopolyspora flexuosa]
MLADLVTSEEKALGVVSARTLATFGTARPGDSEEKIKDRQQATHNQQGGDLAFVLRKPPAEDNGHKYAVTPVFF